MSMIQSKKTIERLNRYSSKRARDLVDSGRDWVTCFKPAPHHQPFLEMLCYPVKAIKKADMALSLPSVPPLFPLLSYLKARILLEPTAEINWSITPDSDKIYGF